MQVNVCMRFHTSFFCEVLVDSNLPCRVKHGTQPLAASRSANKRISIAELAENLGSEPD